MINYLCFHVMEYILLTGRQGHGARLLEQVTGKWEFVSYSCNIAQTVLFCAQDSFAASTSKMSWTLYCWQYALRAILPRSLITDHTWNSWCSFNWNYVANGYQKSVNIPKIVNNSLQVLADVTSLMTRIVHSVLFMTTDCVWDLQLPLSAICMTGTHQCLFHLVHLCCQFSFWLWPFAHSTDAACTRQWKGQTKRYRRCSFLGQEGQRLLWLKGNGDWHTYRYICSLSGLCITYSQNTHARMSGYWLGPDTPLGSATLHFFLSLISVIGISFVWSKHHCNHLNQCIY